MLLPGGFFECKKVPWERASRRGWADGEYVFGSDAESGTLFMDFFPGSVISSGTRASRFVASWHRACQRLALRPLVRLLPLWGSVLPACRAIPLMPLQDHVVSVVPAKTILELTH